MKKYTSQALISRYATNADEFVKAMEETITKFQNRGELVEFRIESTPINNNVLYTAFVFGYVEE